MDDYPKFPPRGQMTPEKYEAMSEEDQQAWVDQMRAEAQNVGEMTGEAAADRAKVRTQLARAELDQKIASAKAEQEWRESQEWGRKQ